MYAGVGGAAAGARRVTIVKPWFPVIFHWTSCGAIFFRFNESLAASGGLSSCLLTPRTDQRRFIQGAEADRCFDFALGPPGRRALDPSLHLSNLSLSSGSLERAKELVRQTAINVYHYAGTCRMAGHAQAAELKAVCDPRLRVRGVCFCVVHALDLSVRHYNAGAWAARGGLQRHASHHRGQHAGRQRCAQTSHPTT